MVWSVFASIGFIGFALALLAAGGRGPADTPGLSIGFAACALTVFANLVAGTFFDCGAHGSGNAGHVLR